MWCWRDRSCGMQCPYCDFEDTKVIDSRLSETKDAVRRRRECLSRSCGKRFTTYERREPLRLMVIKRNGGKEPFDRGKLRAGMADRKSVVEGKSGDLGGRRIIKKKKKTSS